MELSTRNINTLLSSTSTVISQNEKIKKLKGESFNLFSIMQMETAENKTHSNFIAELLKPYGTHQKGSVFLELFLKQFCDNHLDIESTKVKVEHSIGRVNLDEPSGDNATGGRIDIYLWDNYGKTISIENKIDAPEQELQVVRYCNHNRSKNIVFYLNREGKEPSKYSKGNLSSPKDFKVISYQIDILNWLSNCLKESVDQPILRENIRQYAILLKKITNTMDKQFEEDVKKIIVSNLDATRYIRDNANRLLDEIKNNFRIAIMKRLGHKLDASDFIISEGFAINETYAQIWIETKSSIGKPLIFGIESFSGNEHSNIQGLLFVGVMNRNPETNSFELKDMNYMSDYWLHYEEIVLNNSTVCLRKEEFLTQIVDKTSVRFKQIVEEISDQCVSFINSNLDWVEKENIKTTTN